MPDSSMIILFFPKFMECTYLRPISPKYCFIIRVSFLIFICLCTTQNYLHHCLPQLVCQLHPCPVLTKSTIIINTILTPSELWYCWLRDRKGIRPVKHCAKVLLWDLVQLRVVCGRTGWLKQKLKVVVVVVLQISHYQIP